MKTSERHHLKTNEFARRVARAQQAWHTHRRSITAILVTAIVAIAAIAGFYAWRSQRAARANAALADAMAVVAAPVVAASQASAPGGTPPAAPPAGSFPTEDARAAAALEKLRHVADTYGSTDAGVAARYQVASLLAQLRRGDEAAREFQVVIERAGDGLYGRMARLGLAAAHMQTKQYDQAIDALREFVNQPGDLPVDGLLVQLGRAYVLAGRKSEALQAFSRVVDEFPDSLYAAEARREADGLRAAAPAGVS